MSRAEASALIVEFDTTEMACRILEGIIGHHRPADVTAAQALAELDQNDQDGLLRAAGRVMLYLREQTARGVRPS